MKQYQGVTFFHSETGTEGGHWAFQDAKFTHTPEDLVNGKCPWGGNYCPAKEDNRPNPQHWSYEGLHVLKTGDRLKIYDVDDKQTLLWEGEINLDKHPLFTEDASGMWIHADQVGMDRDEWAALFFKEHPAVLETQN
jgi:hypothetical protein